MLLYKSKLCQNLLLPAFLHICKTMYLVNYGKEENLFTILYKFTSNDKESDYIYIQVFFDFHILEIYRVRIEPPI